MFIVREKSKSREKRFERIKSEVAALVESVESDRTATKAVLTAAGEELQALDSLREQLKKLGDE